MTRRDKLWQKAKESPQNLSFDEFETLLGQSNWILERQKGSHRLWISQKGQTLPIQPRKDDKAKPYQIQQFFYVSGGKRLMSLTNYNFDNFTISLYMDEQEDWLAYFQEMPNISAFGDTPQEALEELKTAWELTKEYYLSQGLSIPISPKREKVLVSVPK